MLTGVALVLPRWPIVGRRPELELFERTLGSGDKAGALGARHSGYGARAADYQTLGGALLAALAATLGDEPGDGFDMATRQAWELADNLVAETMLEGAAYQA